MRIPFVPNTIVLAAGVLIVAAVLGLRSGYVPAKFTPWLALDLNAAPGWFMDWRIAQLAHDREACRAVLTAGHVAADPVADRPFRDGCGWQNAVALATAGEAGFGGLTMNCQVAAGLALWMRNVVQPSAQRLLGAKVARIDHLGGYACRNIVGNNAWGKYLPAIRSEHASANAIDIAGFVLDSGDSVSVLRDWNGGGAKSQFLRAVHDGACSYFRVALGPEANEAHRNHFHFDRGPLRSCR